MARKSVWQELRALKRQVAALEAQLTEAGEDQRALMQINEMLQIRNGQLCEENSKLRLALAKHPGRS